MKVTHNFNPKAQVLEFHVESFFLESYFQNFKNMIQFINKESGEVKVCRKTDNTAVISVPVLVDGNSIAINAAVKFSLDTALKEFEQLAFEKERNNLEFIPLSGYSADNLSVEIKDTVEKKRSLLIIKSYKEFLRSNSSNSKVNIEDKFVFNQYRIEYGTKEYFDAVLMIYNKDLSGLRKTYAKKLKETKWL